jgi:hypothetical protein
MTVKSSVSVATTQQWWRGGNHYKNAERLRSRQSC